LIGKLIFELSLKHGTLKRLKQEARYSKHPFFLFAFNTFSKELKAL